MNYVIAIIVVSGVFALGMAVEKRRSDSRRSQYFKQLQEAVGRTVDETEDIQGSYETLCVLRVNIKRAGWGA